MKNFKNIVFASKPMDIVNYNAISIENKNTFFVILYFLFSHSNKETIFTLFKILNISNDQYLLVPQFDLYSLPFIKKLMLIREKKIDFNKVEFDKNLRIKKEENLNQLIYVKSIELTSFFLYRFIRILNRFFFKYYFKTKNHLFINFYIDPHPYKLMHLDLILFKNIRLFDGGRSTMSFKLLKNFKGFLNDIIIFYRNSKYKYLLPKKFENKFKNKTIFYTNYKENYPNNKSINELKIIYNHHDLNIINDSVLILSGNFPYAKTKKIIYNIQKEFVNLKIYYRKHPREKLPNSFFADFPNIILVKSIISAEYDYLKLKMKLPKNIIHWDSSFLSFLSSKSKITKIHYSQIEKNFNYSS